MKYFLIVLALIIIGCDSDNCDQIIDGETLTISDSTLMFIDNYINTNTIMYENQLEQEIVFEVSQLRESKSFFRFTKECEENSEKLQTKQTESEIIELSLYNQQDLLDSIFITLVQMPTNEENMEESLIVTCGKFISNELTESRILLSYDKTETNVTYYDSLTINGKIYYAVYENSNTQWTPNYDIKYTLNEGIVYIRDEVNNIELSYLRKE